MNGSAALNPDGILGQQVVPGNRRSNAGLLAGWKSGLVFTTLVVVAMMMVTAYQDRSIHQLTRAVGRLTGEVTRLHNEQTMPVLILAQHRKSICYIYAAYTLAPPASRHSQRPEVRRRLSATGFVVGDGLIATNRHVVQPWWNDESDEELIKSGFAPHLDSLFAFFPDLPMAIPLTKPVISPDNDVAIVHFTAPPQSRLSALPLNDDHATPGDAVVVLGYPMGVNGMLVKTPERVYRRLAFTHDTLGIAQHLALDSLIRPSATYGHLGDVLGDKLVYDAPTAQGGSGGPVFDSSGRVIGVNSAYIDGFAGGTIGVSAKALKPLIEQGSKQQ